MPLTDNSNKNDIMNYFTGYEDTVLAQIISNLADRIEKLEGK